MPVYRLKVPDLILRKTIGFALFVIDFNGPAVASDAGDAFCLPVEAVGDEKRSFIRKVRLSVVDDQSLLAEVMDGMGMAVAVVGLFFAFVKNADFTKDRLFPPCLWQTGIGQLDDVLVGVDDQMSLRIFLLRLLSLGHLRLRFPHKRPSTSCPEIGKTPVGYTSYRR